MRFRAANTALWTKNMFRGGDYIVLKFARWAFEKFKGVEDKKPGTQMRAVGEVMGIGKTYKEALQKAIRSAGEEPLWSWPCERL